MITRHKRWAWLASMAPIAAVLVACGGTVAPSAAGSAAAIAQPPASPVASTSSPVPGSKPAASAAMPTLKVTYVTTGGTHAPLWLAEATGAFAKHGVNVTDQFIQGDIAGKALVAKEVDIVLQSAAPVITADVNGNAGMVFIGSVLNHSQFALAVNPAIKTATDLKGKVWGSDKPGTTTDYQTKLLIKLLGLQPTDLTIRELGGNDIPFQALLSNQVQAAPMIPPFSFQAKAKGYPILKTTYDQPYQNVGAVVLKSRIEELKPALLAFLAGYRDGIQAFNTQPDLAMKVLQQYTKETDKALLQQTYDFYKNEAPFQTDLQPTPEGIQNMLDFLAATLPAVKGAKPDQFMDTSLLAQLPKA